MNNTLPKFTPRDNPVAFQNSTKTR